MKRRITIFRLMVVVLIAAINFLIARRLMRPPGLKVPAICAFVLFGDAAGLLVIVTSRRLARRKPGDPFSSSTAYLLVLVTLLWPFLLLHVILTITLLILEVAGIG